MQRPGQDPVAKDDVPWWMKYAGRGLGTVGSISEFALYHHPNAICYFTLFIFSPSSPSFLCKFNNFILRACTCACMRDIIRFEYSI